MLVNPGLNTPSPYDMLLLDMNGSVLQNNSGFGVVVTPAESILLKSTQSGDKVVEQRYNPVNYVVGGFLIGLVVGYGSSKFGYKKEKEQI